MSLPPLNSSFDLTRSITNARDTLSDLQRQLASGKRSTTYGGLGPERAQVLSFRSDLSRIEGFQNTVDQVNVRLNVVHLTLNQLRENLADTRSDALANTFALQDNGQTNFQVETKARFYDAVALLNTKVGDNYAFGGRVTDQPPVVNPDLILEGGSGKAGFRQIADERSQADLGADGLGRLVVPATAGAVVSFSEDVDGHPFGFKISAVTSSLTGVAVTAPSGAPITADLTFSATLPQDGETVSITLDLPDGTQTDVTLTASASGPTEAGQFEIGADELATAANFQAALVASIDEAAQTDLRAASVYAAADNFFDLTGASQPQRVDGPPFDSATALVDADPADTVFFYQGEVSTGSARESALAKVDNSITIRHGVRANEDAFRESLKTLAVLSIESFSETDSLARDRYFEINHRAHQNLQGAPGEQSLDNIITEFVVAQKSIDAANERHDASKALLTGFVEDIENADVYEVSAQILSLQGRLEASLSVTASLASISLINFI